jgi:hypothetical protein
LLEILAAHAKALVQRCQIIPYGAASVGRALGIMVSQNRFPRPSCIFIDGDQGSPAGCINLPGEDPPERVVFAALKQMNWGKLAEHTGRPYADLVDACTRAMAFSDHHEWVRHAATELVLGGGMLWQMLCAEWATTCLSAAEAKKIVQAIEDALFRPRTNVSSPSTSEVSASEASTAPSPDSAVPAPAQPDSIPPIELLPLFGQFPDASYELYT